MQVVAIYSASARQHLVGAPIRRRLRLGEGLRVIEILAELLPFRERAVEELGETARAGAPLHRIEHVGNAEPLRRGVGPGKLWIIDEAQGRPDIARLGLRRPRAHRTSLASPIQSAKGRTRRRAQDPADPGHRTRRPGTVAKTVCTPQDQANDVLVHDGGAARGVPDLGQHPSMPVAEPPGGVKPEPRVRVVDLLVHDGVQVAPPGLVHAAADGTPGERARVDEPKVADELLGSRIALPGARALRVPVGLFHPVPTKKTPTGAVRR